MEIKKRDKQKLRLHLYYISNACLALLIILQVSCSKDDDRDEQIRLAHLEQIDFANQEKCNKQERFYDNLEQTGNCSEEYALSQWDCSFENVKTNLEVQNAEFFSDAIEDLMMHLETAYEMHQCGEGALGLSVIIIKQDSSSDKASTEIRRFDFPYFEPAESSAAIGEAEEGVSNEIVDLEPVPRVGEDLEGFEAPSAK
ncbi:MAG: hypothetical protein AB8G05_22105 [Oligoflexales bacterium]